MKCLPACLPGLCVRACEQVYYCVKFHPHDDKQNVFLAGCHDKKIYQFDTQTGARKRGWRGAEAGRMCVWGGGTFDVRMPCTCMHASSHTCTWRPALPPVPKPARVPTSAHERRHA